MDASGNWSLFAGEFFDLVNHFIVGALHLVEKALTDDETDDDANDNRDQIFQSLTAVSLDESFLPLPAFL